MGSDGMLPALFRYLHPGESGYSLHLLVRPTLRETGFQQ